MTQSNNNMHIQSAPDPVNMTSIFFPSVLHVTLLARHVFITAEDVTMETCHVMKHWPLHGQHWRALHWYLQMMLHAHIDAHWVK